MWGDFLTPFALCASTFNNDHFRAGILWLSGTCSLPPLPAAWWWKGWTFPQTVRQENFLYISLWTTGYRAQADTRTSGIAGTCHCCCSLHLGGGVPGLCCAEMDFCRSFKCTPQRSVSPSYVGSTGRSFKPGGVDALKLCAPAPFPESFSHSSGPFFPGHFSLLSSSSSNCRRPRTIVWMGGRLGTSFWRSNIHFAWNVPRTLTPTTAFLTLIS